MIERWLLALPLVLVTALALLALRRRSPLEPVVLLIALTAVIGTYFPLLSSWVPTA